MKAKLNKMQDLAHQLERSKALERLVPDIFSIGRPSSTWRGHEMHPPQGSYIQLTAFEVTDSKGNHTRFHPSDVPSVLVPEGFDFKFRKKIAQMGAPK